MDDGLIRKFFGKYSKKESKERGVAIKEVQPLEGLFEGMHLFLGEATAGMASEKEYSLALQEATRLKYNKGDLENFISKIKLDGFLRFKRIHLGMYFSALINCLGENEKRDLDINLPVELLPSALFYKSKDVEAKVWGSVGNFLAERAEGCDIKVFGNAGSGVCWRANGCKVIIRDKSLDGVCKYATNCRVHVMKGIEGSVKLDVIGKGCKIYDQNKFYKKPDGKSIYKPHARLS